VRFSLLYSILPKPFRKGQFLEVKLGMTRQKKVKQWDIKSKTEKKKEY